MSEAERSLFSKSPAPRRKISSVVTPEDHAYALLRKTFSETYFLTLGAWGALVLWAAFQVYIATEGFQRPFADPDPLRESAILGMAYVGCAFMGLLFGMIQFRPLTVFDQWAFLVHRPFPRTQLFLNMSGAGLAMYGTTVVVPMMLLFSYAIFHAPTASLLFADFTYPYIAGLLTGVPCYFLGAVIVQRQARWFATRFVPLFAGVVAVGLAVSLRYFSVVILFEAAAAVGCGLAAWSSTISQGEDRQVPVAARAGLWAALFAGTAFLAFILGTMGVAAVESYAFSVHPDPASLLQTVPGVVTTDVTPVVSADGHVMVRLNSFRYTSEGKTEPVSVRFVTFGNEAIPNASPLTLESLASVDLSTSVSRYTYRDPDSARQEEEPVSPALVPGMPALASGERLILWNSSSQRGGPHLDVVVTNKRLYVLELSPQGVLAALPLTHPLSLYRVLVQTDQNRGVLVADYSRLAKNSFGTWRAQVMGNPYKDHYREVYDKGGKLLDSAGYDNFDPVFVKNDQAAALRMEHAAALRPYRFVMGLLDGAGMSTNALPIARWTTLRYVYDADGIYWDRDAFAGTIVMNLLAAAALIALGRWYRLSRRAVLAWGVAGLILGPLTLLIFGGFHWRPVRVACPQCHKRRPVNEAECPHCGAGFPAPAANGTEIFAAMSPRAGEPGDVDSIHQAITGGGEL